MYDDCPRCNHHFEIESGYFLGAMDVSYALAIAEGVMVYALARVFTASSTYILSIIVAVILALSLINFMYSRLIWMYLFTRKADSLS